MHAKYHVVLLTLTAILVLCGAAKGHNTGGVADSTPKTSDVVQNHGKKTLKDYIDNDPSYKNMRVGVYMEDLNNPMQYCTAVGQERPSFNGDYQICNEENIFTLEKRDIYVNYLIPRAVEMHSSRLRVLPMSHFLVTRNGAHKCQAVTIPESHFTEGVSDVDFALYVAAGPDNVRGAIAVSSYCAFETVTRRPLVGMVAMDPRKMFRDDNGMRAVAHYLAHIIGFEQPQFVEKGLITTVTGIRGKDTPMNLVTSPTVMAVAREYFGWEDLPGVELEDEGSAGNTSPHWKRRALMDEIMGSEMSASRYSAFTLAAFQDLGYYRANFELAETMLWGFQEGSTLLNEHCIVAGVSRIPEMFCTTSEDTYKCRYDRLGLGRCRIGVYTSDLPEHFQYFSDPAVGGTASLMDYCPIIEGYRNSGCGDGNPDVLPGSIIGSTSRCFEATQTIVVGWYTRTSAICTPVRCNPTNETYSIRLLGKSSYVDCPIGQVLRLADKGSNITGGSITCPPYKSMCAMQLDEDNEDNGEDDVEDVAKMPTPIRSVLLLMLGASAVAAVF